MQGVCKLCDQKGELLLSHILPKSYSKRMRQGAPQVVAVTVEDPPKARKTNGENIERLLCKDCELLLKKKYEDYGTRLFVNRKLITENNDFVLIDNFRYEPYFLYVISILWRAAVSSFSSYKTIQGLSEFSVFFKPCIRKETMTTPKLDNIKLDDFIKLTILRITDTTNEIPQSTIDSMILDINVERGDTIDEGFHCYFMVDGFLIITSIFPPQSAILANWHPHGLVLNQNYLRVPKVGYEKLKLLTEGFNAIRKSQNPFSIIDKIGK